MQPPPCENDGYGTAGGTNARKGKHDSERDVFLARMDGARVRGSVTRATDETCVFWSGDVSHC